MYYLVCNLRFTSALDAMDYAERIYQRTGVFVAVEMKGIKS